MKKLVLVISTLFMMACGEQNNGGAAPPVTTPISNMNCLNGTTYCNNDVYGQYNGWAAYPGLYTHPYDYSNYFYQHGFCHCPGGYTPSYNGTYGLGCVSNQILQPYTGYFVYWYWGTGAYAVSAPQTTINYPQYSNIPGASNSAAACSRTLTQSCLLDQGNTCGAGATCRQTIHGSNLGVCVRY